ncbi:hypothetical protein ACFQ7F_25280 [Streptomyces sp. NPDC056486]
MPEFAHEFACPQEAQLGAATALAADAGQKDRLIEAVMENRAQFAESTDG